jgi:UDP-N-acetylglucosamine diphosphorylase/glucosamine-1-phosphate N-acetyltransferase
MEGRMIQRPWDPIRHNPVQLQHDLAHLPEHRYRPANLAVSGPTDRLWVDPSAQIEPCVVADTSRGPVFIDQHAVVQSFARLEGPCYVGPHCWILGARIRNGTTLGTHCRVGGEIEASIIHGYSSKYHEGFLGHSYLGEWVNLAAGVQISDLRHDYGPIAMRVRGKSVDSEMTKLGSIIGDHTKIGLGVLLNTGTIIGAYCSILPGAGYAPREIPSFCTWVKGQLGEQHDPASLLKVAVEVMRRRGCELKSTHEELFHVVYDATTPHRQQSFRENDHRTYRRRSA